MIDIDFIILIIIIIVTIPTIIVIIIITEVMIMLEKSRTFIVPYHNQTRLWKGLGIMKGTIKNMPPNKSFCFIRGTDRVEYFLHRQDFNGHWNDLVADYNNLPKGENIEVTFDVVESPNGPRASSCSRVDYPN